MEKNDFVIDIDFLKRKSLNKYTGSDRVVVIPEGVACIGSCAFENMDFIDTVILPESVIDIGYGAFRCSSISHVTLPKNVKLIGAYAFESCKNLKTLEIQNPDVSFSQRPFGREIVDFEIVFGGTCDRFKEAARRGFCSSGTHQSGDYYHPSSSRFEYCEYTAYRHIFSDTLSHPFVCTVKCTDGELVYHEMADASWVATK